jgi:hypothetical protein
VWQRHFHERIDEDAKHRFRAMYFQFRFQYRRRALLRAAYRDLMRGYTGLAFGYLDWTIVGRHHPELRRYDAVEAVARAARDKAKTLHEDAESQRQTPEHDREGAPALGGPPGRN